MKELIKNVYIDNDYFKNEQLEYIKEQMLNILDFFDIEEIKKPTFIKIFNNIEEFRSEALKLSKFDSLPEWSVGISVNMKEYDSNYILELSLEEQRKIEYHKNKTLEGFIKTIIHEFVHTCHLQYNNNTELDVWINEGIATYLSNQCENLEYTKEFEEIFSENVVPYQNYRKVFDYVFENYSKQDILKLLKNDKEIKENIINSILNKKIR